MAKRRQYGKETSMRVHPLRFLACFLAVLTLPLAACAGGNNGSTMPDMPPSMSQEPDKLSNSAVTGKYGPRTSYKGENVSSIQADTLDGGLVLPDGQGGVVLIPGEKRKPQNRNYVDAREFKLKIRELAEQLIANIRDCSLQGTVALPTSFVSLDNFNETSSLGRLISEQLFYEFNQRGYPIREYRIPGSINVREEGEFYLSRELGDLALRSPGSVIIVGTYSGDKQALFINARLVRPSDGRVLRTANLVLEGNPLTNRLMRNTGKKFEAGEMRIRDHSETTKQPMDFGGGPGGLANPFDRGEDIH